MVSLLHVRTIQVLQISQAIVLCVAGGNNLDFCTDSRSFFKVTETHLKIGYPLAKGHLDELQKAEKYPITWSL